MFTAILSFLVGFSIGCVLILILGMCLSAAHADRLAERMLGPASSDPDFEREMAAHCLRSRDLTLSLLMVDDDATPHGRRHG